MLGVDAIVANLKHSLTLTLLRFLNHENVFMSRQAVHILRFMQALFSHHGVLSPTLCCLSRFPVL